MSMVSLDLASMASSQQSSQPGSPQQSSPQRTSCSTWRTRLDLDGESPRVDGVLGLGASGVASAASTAFGLHSSLLVNVRLVVDS